MLKRGSTVDIVAISGDSNSSAHGVWVAESCRETCFLHVFSGVPSKKCAWSKKFHFIPRMKQIWDKWIWKKMFVIANVQCSIKPYKNMRQEFEWLSKTWELCHWSTLPRSSNSTILVSSDARIALTGHLVNKGVVSIFVASAHNGK